jgi:hypothetical protein
MIESIRPGREASSPATTRRRADAGVSRAFDDDLVTADDDVVSGAGLLERTGVGEVAGGVFAATPPLAHPRITTGAMSAVAAVILLRTDRIMLASCSHHAIDRTIKRMRR